MNKFGFLVAGLLGLGAAVNGFGMANVYVNLQRDGGETNFVWTCDEDRSTSIELPVGVDETFFRVAVRPRSYPSDGVKHRGLFVGIDEYIGEEIFEGSVLSAHAMVDMMTTNSLRGPIKDYVLLKDSAAHKAAIRGAIQDAAGEMEAGDVFVYFQRSRGGQDPASLRTYDEEYTATELAEDLALFKDGVKTVVILDAHCSGGMAPESGVLPQAVLDEYKKAKWAKGAGLANVTSEDVCFLTATQADEYAWTEYGNCGVFVEEMYVGGCSGNADENGDMHISMGELFRGTVGHMELMGDDKLQHPYIYNEELADTIMATRMYDYKAMGQFEIKDEKLYYTINSVPGDLYLDIELVNADENPYALTMKNLSLNFNLASGDETNGLPTKVKGSFEVPLTGINLYESLAGPVYINGRWYGYAFLYGYNKNKVTYLVVDRYWQPVGKLMCKGNVKKGIFAINYSLKAISPWYVKAFDKQNGQQAMACYVNLGDFYSTGLRAGTVKYKEGKKLTVKLTKEKIAAE